MDFKIISMLIISVIEIIKFTNQIKSSKNNKFMRKKIYFSIDNFCLHPKKSDTSITSYIILSQCVNLLSNIYLFIFKREYI